MEDTFILHCEDNEFILEPPLRFETNSCLCISQQYCGKQVTANGRTRKDVEVKFELRNRSATLSSSSSSIVVHAVLGTVCLLRGYYLAVVTKSKLVESISVENNGRLAEYRKIIAADFLPIPFCCDAQAQSSKGATSMETVKEERNDNQFNLNANELKLEQLYLNLLQHVVSTKSLFYAHNYDLTNSLQRAIENRNNINTSSVNNNVSNNNPGPSCKLDERFIWNLSMLAEFEKKTLSDWTQPIICGYVEVRKYVSIPEAGLSFSYIFISRRGNGRQGTRFIVRGLDENGCAANFVETEVLVVPDPKANANASTGVAAYSFVQTRGSIPLSWSQQVTLKYMPRVKIAKNDSESCKRFRKHFLPGGEHGVDKYGNVVAVNLIDRVGKAKTIKDQRALGNHFKRECDKLEPELEKLGGSERLRFVWFDFHHECRKMQWQNLSKLLGEVKSELSSHGYFTLLRNGSVEKKQTGVLRTNCMDNLDRTNVVQSLFARHIAIEQIKQEMTATAGGTLEYGSNVLESPFPKFEQMFKNVWANNADAMSVLYSGTPALKTDFTRTGKRTKVGLLKDGINSVLRFYLNNFCDGTRQDAFDLFLGKFDAHNDVPFKDLSREKLVSSSSVAVFTNTLFVYMIVFLFISVFTGVSMKEDLWITQKLFVAFWITLLSGLGLLFYGLKKGLNPTFTRKYVTTSSLLPEICHDKTL